MSTSELRSKVEQTFKELAATVEYGSDVCGPASESEICEVERIIGKSMPAECRIALEFFNGTNALVELPIGEDAYPAHFGGIYPVEQWPEITKQWRKDLEFWGEDFAQGKVKVIGPVRPVPIHDDWVMFSYGYDFNWFLDFSPAPGGTVGQIVMLYAMPDEHRIQVMAPNFLVFLQLMIQSLKGEWSA